jgi:hypothetical protein
VMTLGGGETAALPAAATLEQQTESEINEVRSRC